MPAAGVPDSVPLPSGWGVNETPEGSGVVMETVASGKASVTTVNVPAAPTVNVAAAVLVKCGASFTVSVKDCVDGGPPLAAESVSA